jgi:hypothetical protein
MATFKNFLCFRYLKNYRKYCSELYAHADHAGQFLTCTLSVRIRNWCMRWAYKSGTGACTEHTDQVLMRAQGAVPSKHAEHTQQELMRTLSIQVRNWCVHWAYASGTNACTLHRVQSLQNMLSIRIRNGCVPWAYRSGTDACTEPTSQELMPTLSMRIRNEMMPRYPKN